MSVNLTKLRARLLTQDNRATAHPIFIVQQEERIFGVDPAYTDDFAPMNDDGDELNPSLMSDDEQSEAEWFGYLTRWEFVTACLTEDGAQAYINRNGHNLKNPRIYVASAHGNQEWIDLRELLTNDAERILGIGGHDE